MIPFFFITNPDYGALFYSASFFLLGVASILLHLHQRSVAPRSRDGILLACFSFALSLYELMGIVAYELMRPELWQAERNVLLVLGFIALFEFGVLHARSRSRVPVNVFVLAPLVACAATIAWCLKSDGGCEAVIRTLFALPAALLAAFAFWRGAAPRVPVFEASVFSARFSRLLAGTFLLYGFCAGVVVPGALSGLPVFLSERRFFELVGLPVSVFRAACATLLAGIFIWQTTRSLFFYRSFLGLRRRSTVGLPLSFGLLYVVFIVFGWHLVKAVTIHEQDNVKRLVLRDARLYAQALLGSSDIDILSLTQRSAYPALRHAHHRMVDLTQQDSFAKALYLVRLEDERPVFLVGSQAQVYPSVVFPSFGESVPLRYILDAFHGRHPTFVGPYRDRWDKTSFTVFLPLDRPEGATLYLLGVDLDARKIFVEIRRVRLFALFGVMAFLVLFIVGCAFLLVFAVKNTELEAQKRGLDEAVTHLRETEAQLARSEETFRGILDNSPNAIFGFDRDLRLIFWNKEAGRLYGYEKHEVINEKDPLENRRIVELLGIKSYEQEAAGIFKGQTIVREMTHKTKSGQALDVVLTAFPVQDPKGSILFGMGLVQDISGHRRIETILEEEQGRLRIIAAHIGAGLSLIDRDFRILWVNEVVEGWFGKLEAVKGRHCFDAYAGCQGVCKGCPTEQAFLTGAVSTAEQRATFPDGRVMDFLIISSPIKDAMGETQQVLELVQDVTERKRLEEELKIHTQTLEGLVEERTAALQTSERMFRRLFESAQDGILIMDAEHGNIIDVNPYLLQLMEMTRDELQGRPFHATKLFLENPVLRNIPQELGDKIAVFHDDVVVATAGGREINVEIRASWYYVADRRVIQCHLRDITERKKIERIKSEFVSMVSHELRTPLSAIKEGVEIVADGTQGKLNRSQKECLEIALSNIRRLNRLIGDILDISKIQSNLLTVKLTACEVAEIVNQVYHLARIEIEKSGLVLVTDIEKRLPRVMADRDRLNNAVKFTREHSRIRLTCRWIDEEVEFAVADEGPGIPDEELARLFGRFVQLDSTLVRRVGGTGLGLYISKNLVDAMGGRIWAESKLGEGAVFKFALPVEKEAKR